MVFLYRAVNCMASDTVINETIVMTFRSTARKINRKRALLKKAKILMWNSVSNPEKYI